MNDELDRTWKESVAAYFKESSRNLLGETEANHETLSLLEIRTGHVPEEVNQLARRVVSGCESRAKVIMSKSLAHGNRAAHSRFCRHSGDTTHCRICVCKLSVAGLHSVECRRDRRIPGRDLTGSDRSVYLDGLTKTKKNLRQGSRRTGPDLNQAPPEYDTRATSTPTRSVLSQYHCYADDGDDDDQAGAIRTYSW